MARAVADIEHEIRALDTTDQEHILRVLLEALAGPPDADAERAWLEEAQRRSAELEAGLVTPEPAEAVFARARASLRRR